MLTHDITITTIDDDEYEGDTELICLRTVNPEEPCPGKIILNANSETAVNISENDRKLHWSAITAIMLCTLAFALRLECFTSVSGNSVTGYFITVIYFVPGDEDVSPTFECELNDNGLETCRHN